MHSASKALRQLQHQVRQHRLLPLHLHLWLCLWQHANLRLWLLQQQWHRHLRRLRLSEQLGLLLPLWQLLRLWLHLHRQPLPLLLLRLQVSLSRWDFSRDWLSLSLALGDLHPQRSLGHWLRSEQFTTCQRRIKCLLACLNRHSVV
jgi:hypothetical protein